MSGEVLAFAVFGLVALGSAQGVVWSRNPVVSALWLALALVATAGIFLVLGAEFLAVAQIIIYAGAILVFFLFVVMLLNLGTLSPPEDRHPVQFHLALYSVLALVLILTFVVRMAGLAGAPATAAVAAGESQTRALAALLFTRYLAPFELASVLLLVAMVGAVVLAKRRI